jgi:hypothetical protein
LAQSQISSWCVQGNKWSAYRTCIGYKKTFRVALCNGVHLLILWLLLSYQ